MRSEGAGRKSFFCLPEALSEALSSVPLGAQEAKEVSATATEEQNCCHACPRASRAQAAVYCSEHMSWQCSSYKLPNFLRERVRKALRASSSAQSS